MGTYMDSDQYGYNLEILNTFEQGRLKKKTIGCAGLRPNIDPGPLPDLFSDWGISRHFVIGGAALVVYLLGETSKKYTLLLNATAFWLKPTVMNFDVFP